MITMQCELFPPDEYNKKFVETSNEYLTVHIKVVTFTSGNDFDNSNKRY